MKITKASVNETNMNVIIKEMNCVSDLFHSICKAYFDNKFYIGSKINLFYKNNLFDTFTKMEVVTNSASSGFRGKISDFKGTFKFYSIKDIVYNVEVEYKKNKFCRISVTFKNKADE